MKIVKSIEHPKKEKEGTRKKLGIYINSVYQQTKCSLILLRNIKNILYQNVIIYGAPDYILTDIYHTIHIAKGNNLK